MVSNYILLEILNRSNGNTGLDPLENHKATKPEFNVGSLARQRNAIMEPCSMFVCMHSVICIVPCNTKMFYQTLTYVGSYYKVKINQVFIFKHVIQATETQ